MRQTSLDAYDNLKASGVLGQRQLLAWVCLLQKGPMTGGELSAYAELPGLWKRLSELKKFGLAIEDGVRPCKVTGTNALVWRAVVGSALRPKREPPRRKYWIVQGNHVSPLAYHERRHAETALKDMLKLTTGIEIVEVVEVRKKAKRAEPKR